MGSLQPLRSVFVCRAVQLSAKSGINNAGHVWITSFCQSRLAICLTGSAGGFFVCLRCVGMDKNGPGGHCFG